MLGALKHTISRTMQRAALGGLGGLLTLVGTGFLTTALYLYVQMQSDPITACLILGGGFVGLGLLVLGLSRGNNNDAHLIARATPQPVATQAPIALVIAAFLDGLQQGLAARDTPKPSSPR